MKAENKSYSFWLNGECHFFSRTDTGMLSGIIQIPGGGVRLMADTVHGMKRLIRDTIASETANCFFNVDK